MRAIQGVVQHYAWGDRAAIPSLIGARPDGQPWAELWFGTHHGGPASFADGSPLSGTTGDLPYLVKLLAAAEPLSLQTHPDAATARQGYADEEQRRVALDDPTRLYRDPHAKPELLCALSPFVALCGFMAVGRASESLRSLGAASLADVLERQGLPATVASMFRRALDVDDALAACRHSNARHAQLAVELDERYPGDPGAAVALLMNLVELEPGEALYLTPGNLHAYVSGVGIEVMGASDNVLRGGLTRKHVDVGALLEVMRVEPLDDPVVRPSPVLGGSTFEYPTPDAPFRVQRIDLDGRTAFTATDHELIICVEGAAPPLATGTAVHVAPGEDVELHGSARLFRISPT